MTLRRRSQRRSELPHWCVVCDARWSGSDTAHCAVCHCTFTGPASFDAHRPGGACAEPRSLGMVTMPGRAYRVWRMPSAEPEPEELDRPTLWDMNALQWT